MEDDLLIATITFTIRDSPQVEAQDTSVIAQLGWPDMRLPLLYSLSWPHRVRMSYDQLDLAKLCMCFLSSFDPKLSWCSNIGRYLCFSSNYSAFAGA